MNYRNESIEDFVVAASAELGKLPGVEQVGLACDGDLVLYVRGKDHKYPDKWGGHNVIVYEMK